MSTTLGWRGARGNICYATLTVDGIDERSDALHPAVRPILYDPLLDRSRALELGEASEHQAAGLPHHLQLVDVADLGVGPHVERYGQAGLELDEARRRRLGGGAVCSVRVGDVGLDAGGALVAEALHDAEEP